MTASLHVAGNWDEAVLRLIIKTLSLNAHSTHTYYEDSPYKLTFTDCWSPAISIQYACWDEKFSIGDINFGLRFTWTNIPGIHWYTSVFYIWNEKAWGECPCIVRHMIPRPVKLDQTYTSCTHTCSDRCYESLLLLDNAPLRERTRYTNRTLESPNRPIIQRKQTTQREAIPPIPCHRNPCHRNPGELYRPIP